MVQLGAPIKVLMGFVAVIMVKVIGLAIALGRVKVEMGVAVVRSFPELSGIIPLWSWSQKGRLASTVSILVAALRW